MSDKKFERNTRQREVILEELRKVTSHPTASELYEMVKKRLPRVSLGTVYRNLELLAQKGMILKLDSSGSQARFDGNPERHSHVRCLHCSKVIDMHGFSIDIPEEVFKNYKGFKITSFNLEFVGFCSTCQEELGDIDSRQGLH